MPEKTRKPATESAANPEKAKRQKKAAQKNQPSQAGVEEMPQCHIHDEVQVWDNVDEIRANVCCNDEPPTEHTDSKYYCLFHLPAKEKAEKFEEKFKERLEKIKEKLKRVENLPEEEREAERRKISYDFRYAWFPALVNFSQYKFSADAYFSLATFSADAYFSSATFSAYAYFSSATFSAYAYFSKTTFSAYADFGSAIFSAYAYFSSATFSAYANFSKTTFSANASFSSATFSAYADFSLATFSAYAYFSSATFSADASFISVRFSAYAYFSSATFSADADFGSATFSAYAYFSSATFSADADFSEATFSADADFRSATFSAYAYFTRTKFSKTNSTSFQQAKFTKKVFFDSARFRNFITFESAVFEDKSDVFFRHSFFAGNADFQYCTAEGYLRFSDLRQGKDSKFDFQEAAFEKADRVSIHTARLQPNWFVNVDARKFVFTDITWENFKAENGNKNIWRELESLKECGIEDSGKRLLEVACRQLAVNAEENNLYEDASKFRYMAMETRRLEHKGWRRFFNLHFFYKWSSGYGENWRRALVVLLCLLAGFGLIYNSPFLSSFDWGDHQSFMAFWEALLHSLKVAALQRPEPKPADVLTGFFVILETIFAPLQAALLALAIRRKFMR